MSDLPISMDFTPAELTPHIRDGPVERLSISELPPARNISPDVTSPDHEDLKPPAYLQRDYMT